MPLDFALALHAHQPAGNFDDVIEATYQGSYLPFLTAASERGGLKFNLHFSGYLLDWIAARHPEYIAALRALVAQGRAEMLGGGYFEPILPAISLADRLEQIARLSDRLEALFGRRPRGMWLAERVWEPDLPQALARAGMAFTLLDDFHFQLAGLETGQLHGCFITEHQGARVRIFPCSQFLREAIPFRPEGDSLAFLRAAAARSEGVLTMGDDLEKFGSWPGTHRHVYEQAWLQRFLDGLEAGRDEIRTVLLSDALERHEATGPVYLPTASYPEMLQWALPYAAAARLRGNAEGGTAAPPGPLPSAPWRAFLAKYREANLMHKRQQDLAFRLRRWREQARAAPAAAAYRQARDAVLAAQANDAYWHGWFGGLYAPHLRNEVYRHLIAADRLCESLAGAEPLRRLDLDCDGADEVELRSPALRVLATPADGGCVAEIDYRPADANLINSLQRRPEIYHEEIRRRARSNPAGLPEPAAAAPPELAAALCYDRYPRVCGRLLVFGAGKGCADFAALTLEEDAAVAAGRYRIRAATPGRLALEWSGADGEVQKEYRLREPDRRPRGAAARTAGPRARLTLAAAWQGARFAADALAALECTFNLMAPGAADRWMQLGNRRMRLDFAGALDAGNLMLCDGWRRFRITLTAAGAAGWWVTPVFTVSQGETGFERVFQGSAVAAVWPPGVRRLRLAIEVAPLADTAA